MVVLHFVGGNLLKGCLREFSPESQNIAIEPEKNGELRTIPVKELKAIFFVKTFEGKSGRREKKIYGIRREGGKKIFVKFIDGESMVGFLDGSVPWDKGFFLSRPDDRQTGFFLIPADDESNNKRVFVVGSSVRDITTLS